MREALKSKTPRAGCEFLKRGNPLCGTKSWKGIRSLNDATSCEREVPSPSYWCQTIKGGGSPGPAAQSLEGTWIYNDKRAKALAFHLWRQLASGLLHKWSKCGLPFGSRSTLRLGGVNIIPRSKLTCFLGGMPGRKRRSEGALVLGVLQSRSSTPKTSPKNSVHVDGLQPSAEMGFKAWRLSEGRWKLRFKSGCCERTDAAVRALLLQARGVNLLSGQSASSPA